MLLALLSACQEPFPEDRHDLSDFRIVAMTGTREDPAATVWSTGGLWHQPLPEMVYWKAGNKTGFGVTAIDGGGHQEEGWLTIDEDAVVPTLAAFSRSEDTDGTWAIEVEVAVGSTHFMAPAGTFTETGPNTTTWDPEGATGIIPVIALTFDGLGGNRVDVIDLPVGVDPPWLEIGGRVFPYDGGLDGETSVLATLAAEDDYHGISLTEVEQGTDAEPFDFDALGRAEVARDDVVGLRVLLDATAVGP